MKRRLRWFLLGPLALPLGYLGFLGWIKRPRAQPPDVDRQLFAGVTYHRKSSRIPRPLVLHLITINLRAKGLQFVVTPGDPRKERPLRAQTTSEFLQTFRCQVAINGDYFYPWRSNAPWDYYPHRGDPVSVQGDAVSRGKTYAKSDGHSQITALYLSKDNRATIGKRPSAVYNAIGGHKLDLSRRTDLAKSRAVEPDLQPCTGVGIDATGKRLFLLLVDGRQPNYSEGVTKPELAAFLYRAGARSAMNLDGGGSTVLVIAGADGRPQILNSPIDNHIPGRERVVANHLGIFASR